MLEPLLMSKAIFDGLPADQQKAIVEVGAEMEAFALEARPRRTTRLAEGLWGQGAEIPR